MTTGDTFKRELARRLRAHCAGLLLREGLNLLAWAALLLAALVTLDFFLALSERARMALGLASIVFLALHLLRGIYRASRRKPQDLARWMDQHGVGSRRAVQAAWDLSHGQGVDATELERFLRDRAIAQGTEAIRAASRRVYWPVAAVRRQFRVTAVLLLVVALGLAASHRVSRVVLARIFDPGADIPPWSRFVFTVTPEEPVVVYGGTLEVRAEISGAPVTAPVWLQTRRAGRVQATACFQDGPGRYAQRLEKMVEPVEFAFTTGRARSRWQRAEILLEPRIAAARLRVAPPAYTRRVPVEFIAGEQRLAGLVQSEIELDLTSNRPLDRGRLTVRTEGHPDLQIDGERAGVNRLRFRWPLERPGAIEVLIWDLRGTPNQEPFRLQQFVTTDEPPTVVLTDPPAFSVATPKAKIPVAGYAEDDVGLARVDLVRALAGFRDRALHVGPESFSAKFAHEQGVDLARLGVQPGDILEFYLEALDVNPALTGLAASPLARVQIITVEDYTDMMRSRTRAAEYAERFQAAHRTLDELVREMEALRDELREGGLEAGERDQRWAALVEKNQRTEERLREIAADFPLFEGEQKLVESLAEAADTVAEHGRWMKDVVLEDGYVRTLDAALARMGVAREDVTRQAQDAELLGRVGELMHEAQRYAELLASQETLVRRMERLVEEGGARMNALAARLAADQAVIRTALAELRDTLRELAPALPEELAELRDSSLNFARLIDELTIPETMDRAADFGQKHEPRAFLREAGVALARMRELLSKDECKSFGGMCQGSLRFQVRENLRETISQMFNAWCRGTGMGREGGAGAGGFGDASDGFWMQGSSTLNVPAYGPSRSAQFPQRGSVQGSHGRGGFMRARRGPAIEQGSSGASAPGGTPGELVPVDAAPEPYRDALKRYFGEGKVGP